jgi:hypothetical protein
VKAAAGALIAIAALELGALVWAAASHGHEQGLLDTGYLVFIAVPSCAIIAQAGVVWLIVGRNPTANPAWRAALCLTYAIVSGVAGFVTKTPDGLGIPDIVLLLSISLGTMSSAMLIAMGIARIYVALGARR